MEIRNLLIVSATALLVACGGGGGGGSSGSGTSTAKFTVAVAPASVTASQGSGVLIPVTLSRDAGFTDSVTVTLDNPPAGIEADTVVFSGANDKALLPVSVTSSATLGDSTLAIVGKAGTSSHKASATLTVNAHRATAQENIASALKAGTLDYGTSLLYRAYALLGDKRLPSEIQGSGSAEEDNGLFEEIRKNMGSLSADQQAQLQPFLVRPADPASVWNATAVATLATPATKLKMLPLKATAADAPPISACPAESGSPQKWISKRSASRPVRVWAQCKGELAYDAGSQTLLDETLAVLDKIYGPMTALMGEPILDQEGGDNAIDFYILDTGSYVFRRNDNFDAQGLGSTYSDFPEVNNGASAFVTLPRFLAYIQRFHTTVIHEFFHVLQKRHNHQFSHRQVANASNVYEQHWFGEASAVWASAHFDRTLAPWSDGRSAYSDAHQRFVLRFQVSTEGLNAPQPEPHTYSAYIWPYFVEQEKNGPAFMGQIWAGLETVTTFEQADDVIDASYAFADNFKTFALRNLNNEFAPSDPLPRAKRYVNQDPEQFPDGVAPTFVTGEAPIELVADQEFRQSLDIENLSARYLRLTAGGTVRKVEFDFTGLQPQDLTDVQALIRTTDGWVAQAFDYSTTNTVTFCFTEGPTTATRNGSFVEMILVVSNHAKREGNKVTGALVAKPQSKSCVVGWKGRSSYTFDDGFGSKSTIIADVTFEFDDTAPQTAGIPYRLLSGNLSFLMKSGSTCVLTTTAGGPMLKVPLDLNVVGSTQARLGIFPTPPPGTYSGQGATVVATTETDCTGGVTHNTTVLGWLGIGTAEPVSDDGNTLQGFYQTTDATGTNRHEWLFQKVLE
jgi:hypothetical protein